ncbi:MULTISPECIES: DNA helicase PcrA [unclassified Coleofasciculus]|uniref:DNA helicase PcrA n=1 Tax=unclassified Coleofasciculus TaxID=2692782 RepID=UPI001881CE5E|nr:MULTISPECIES: DNA helicase PcrA [unclassified Coleofasciculus]MBE9128078.1 DNA helicase PcrA [Coleofasciculus sp. LEGE 07081]MBE9146951.1 DNA helicase PcrA [Coleofasciculus sp. LEGE 07092]
MTQTTDFLTHLNSSQRRAVEHFCGPLLVVAGAGSGKTRALTYRIANLILTHKVDPENILAVTFTNKAAREMKSRIEMIFAQQLAAHKHSQRLELLPEAEQTQLRSQVYKKYIKPLWIGTFHSLFARILRYDINKYQDEQGRQWNRNFSIFDDSDAQTLVKTIVTKQLNLDDKKFDPRKIRYAISNAKNLGLSPQEFEKEQSGYKGRVYGEVYSHYQEQLAANNALDFDDLILVPVKLFQQNESVLGYWHKQFRHILVDEYQDTNRIQYDLIRLLATNDETRKNQWDWRDRSVFVVGDADQSIYSFRMADFTILLGFQADFGDGLPDEATRTMVKLEENYRSRENILQAANYLIEKNTQRIDKILRATRGLGEQIYCHKAEDELEEAQFVVGQILKLTQENPELDWGSFAILYRTNAQSRPIEDALRGKVPYIIVGGLKFYDRKEIKDALAYLRAIANPSDTVSLLRIINTPRRGIGQATIDHLVVASRELGVPLWEIISDETSVNTLAGRSAKAVNKFGQVIRQCQEQIETLQAAEIVKSVMEESGYIDDLKKQGTDEAENRLENISELYNAVLQFQEENEDTSLEGFLANASLASDLDNLEEGQKAVSLMTLHSAKGLEFPVVFLVGLEQGLLPHSRTLNDPIALEEERRLCYVGITRAQEQLFLSHARERRLYGYREPAVRSQFLEELPADLISSTLVKVKSAHQLSKVAAAKGSKSKGSKSQTWKKGDLLIHEAFGTGEVTHVFGSGNKISIAVKFSGLGQKIIDPKQTSLQRVE